MSCQCHVNACPCILHALIMSCPCRSPVMLCQCRACAVSMPCPMRAYGISMPCPWRAHAVPVPYRAAKCLECGRGSFTFTMPGPHRAPTMPFFSRPRHSTSDERRNLGYLHAFRYFPTSTRRSMKAVNRSIPIADAGGQCETKQRLSWTRERVVAAH